jgi:glycopeptide antibiotics resistance protein
MTDKKWNLVILIISIGIILIATLFPFNFVFPSDLSLQTFSNQFERATNLNDRLGNVLLFIPLGFGLASFLNLSKKRNIFIIALLISAILSSTVEILQVFLPSRAPTISDIFTNTIGGGLGACFYLSSSQTFPFISVLISKIKQFLSPQLLLIAYVSFFFVSCLITLTLPNGASLNNWSENFPLLLGNETTKDRPWQGYIRQLQISDRAFSNTEINQAFSNKNFLSTHSNSFLASYNLTEGNTYQDLKGNSPNLVWQGKPPKTESRKGKGIFLNGDRFLTTILPATEIAQKLKETNQFTLNTIVAANKTQQTGPARIISFSDGPFRRNFTLGQEGSSLIFRLRSSVTGGNGTAPELIIPRVFKDTNFHHLLITFDGNIIKFYIDFPQTNYKISLNTGVIFSRYLLVAGGTWRIDIASFNQLPYYTLYYSMILIPLGLILGLLLAISRCKLIIQILLICSGIILPAAILTGLLVTRTGSTTLKGSALQPALTNLLPSIIISIIVAWIIKTIYEKWRH